MILRALVLLAMMCFASSAARAEEGRMAKGEVEGFALEIPDEFGKKQALLEGAHAGFEPGGAVKISEVKATIQQKEKNKGPIVVTSPYANYHRDTKIVTTDQPVQIDSNDTHITGTGLVWDTEKQNIEIGERVRVVLKNINKEPK